jgi:hypothetical protein
MCGLLPKTAMPLSVSEPREKEFGPQPVYKRLAIILFHLFHAPFEKPEYCMPQSERNPNMEGQDLKAALIRPEFRIDFGFGVSDFKIKNVISCPFSSSTC